MASIREEQRARIRNQFFQFLVFVLISSSIWLVIKLSGIYPLRIQYVIETPKFYGGNVLTSISDSLLTVGIEAKGFDILRSRLFLKKPGLSIDFSMLRRTPGYNLRYYINSTDLLRLVANQLSVGSEVFFVAPDTIWFRFEKEVKKRIPVHNNLSLAFRPQFGLYGGVRLEPDTVVVAGTRADIERIEFIGTEYREIPDLHQTVELNVGLIQPHSTKPLWIEPNEVRAVIQVEKFTEAVITVPIRVRCYETTYALRIFPDSVRLTALVAMIDYRRIDAGLFEAGVHCHPDTIIKMPKLPVTLERIPPQVKITRIDPPQVEYLVVFNK